MRSLRECAHLAAIVAISIIGPPAPAAPNVVLIMADDLGYGDLGCYGQEKIATPRLDRLAAEGVRFTQFYAGSTVCAPSRCVLMTGRHTGRCWVRGNAGGRDMEAQTLRDEDKTVAEVFKDAGYATGQFGKWGLGELGSPGHPNAQGFDEFFGYLNQRHAHNYYPPFLVHNGAKVALRNVPADGDLDLGDGWAQERVDYSHDLVMAKALDWLAANRDRPFFLYLPLTIPHANNEGRRGTGNGQEVPDYGFYADKGWPDPDKGQAAMITRMDADIGRLLDRLREYGIDDNTLVLFTSDNGPHQEGGNRPDFFDANGPFRGLKRALYDGGIRVPMIARWPGTIAAGAVSDHVGYGGDFFATACQLTGQPLPEGLDSVSFVPELKGEPQPEHPYLYWEFYEQGSRQAVRFGDWKAVRQPMFSGQVELYDLATDPGESTDLAAQHADLVEKAKAMMDEAHTPDAKWQVR
jgi:uncharacterized sulfatase